MLWMLNVQASSDICFILHFLKKDLLAFLLICLAMEDIIFLLSLLCLPAMDYFTQIVYLWSCTLATFRSLRRTRSFTKSILRLKMRFQNRRAKYCRSRKALEGLFWHQVFHHSFVRVYHLVNEFLSSDIWLHTGWCKLVKVSRRYLIASEGILNHVGSRSPGVFFFGLSFSRCCHT